MWLNSPHALLPQLFHLLPRNNEAGKAPSFLYWHHWRGIDGLYPQREQLRWHWATYLSSTLAAHSEWSGHCYTSQANLALRQTKYYTDSTPIPSISSNFTQSGRGTPTWQPAPWQLTEIMSTRLTLTQNSFKLPSPCAALSPAAFRIVFFTAQLPAASCPHCSFPPLLALVPAICCQFLDKSHPQTSSFCLLHCPLPHSPEVSSPISHLARRVSSSSLGEHSWIEKHQLKKKGGVGME